MPRTLHRLDRSTLTALCLGAAVGSVALVLIGRAIAGAFDASVGPVIPLLATLLTLSGGLAAWTLFHRDARRGDVGRRLFDGLLATLPSGVAGYAASVHASPATLAAVTGLLVMGLVYVACREGTRTLSAESIGGETALATLPSVHSIPLSSMPIDRNEEEALVELPDAGPIRQTLTRRCLEGGREEIEAVLTAEFEPGERWTVLHLPIHPVLRGSIQVECEPLEDASIVLQATAVYPYGVRIEVKRSRQLDRPATVPVGVYITSTAAESAA